ncbi:hypothetical protein BC628DRAFT_1382086 [Trametes gibbosa]|nr:hypothetical protein BC628DRAFT_1382086 [Trametes gibbosa]
MLFTPTAAILTRAHLSLLVRSTICYAIPTPTWMFYKCLLRPLWLVVLTSTLSLPGESTITSEQIDDSDSRIVYGGGPWTHSPPADDPLHNNANGTLSSTTVKAAYAELIFNGTFVAVYGMRPPTDDNVLLSSTYTLDQGLPVKESLLSGSGTGYRAWLWQSGSMPLGVHTLRIENRGSIFYLDYLIVEGTAPNPTSQTTTIFEMSQKTPMSFISASSPPPVTVTMTLSATIQQPGIQSWTFPSTTSITSSRSSLSTAHSLSNPIQSPVPTSDMPVTRASSSTPISSSSAQSPATVPSMPTTPTTPVPLTLRAPESRISAGEIAGVAVGAAAVVHLVLIAMLYIRCRRRKRAKQDALKAGRDIHADDQGRLGSKSGASAEHLVCTLDACSPEASSVGWPLSQCATVGLNWEDASSYTTVSDMLSVERTPRTTLSDTALRRFSTPKPSSLTPRSSSGGSRRNGTAAFASWHETDAGVRLAGGRPGEELNRGGATEQDELFPPPYSSTYGSRTGSPYTLESL